MAYVEDDPSALFKVAVVSATTAISYVNRTSVGNNAVLVQNSGSTTNGNSKVAVSSTTATTSTFPVPIAGYPGSYTEVIVKWNAPNVTGQTVAGGHQYLNPTGV
jgi:hypothetical protein